ncbi:MAG: TauD/TfdA family dioxygenase [Pyrinomonadaceae bacterium]
MPKVASSVTAPDNARIAGPTKRQPPCIFKPALESASKDSLEKISILHKAIRHALLYYGAVVLSDFGVSRIDQFKEIVEDFSTADLLKYAGGASPRSALADGVYTSTEYPPEMPLALHNELSYAAAYPRTLFFFCEMEPHIGGETTLGDSRRILSAIDPEIADLFRSKGVLYVRNLVSDKTSQYSWQAAFETDDREMAEEVCRRQGSHFEWTVGGGLRVSFIGPATMIHPETGEEVWFNQADGFHSGELQNPGRAERPRLEAYFGDASEIPKKALEHIRTVIRRETIPHRWKQGDILIIDNILNAHGRMPFSGPRKIALAMA